MVIFWETNFSTSESHSVSFIAQNKIKFLRKIKVMRIFSPTISVPMFTASMLRVPAETGHCQLRHPQGVRPDGKEHQWLRVEGFNPIAALPDKNRVMAALARLSGCGGDETAGHRNLEFWRNVAVRRRRHSNEISIWHHHLLRPKNSSAGQQQPSSFGEAGGQADRFRSALFTS